MMAECCVVCGGDDVEAVASEGLVVCTRCGNVSESNVPSDEPEWRMFSVDEETIESSRVGHCEDGLDLVNNLSSQLTLGCGGHSSDRWLECEAGLTNREKSILTTKRTIELLCEEFHLKRRVADSSLELFSQYLHSDSKRCRSGGVLVSSLVFTACRMTKTILSLEALSEFCHVEKNKIRSYHMYLKQLLGLVIPRLTYRDFIEHYGPRLSLEWKVRELSIALIDAWQKSTSNLVVGNHGSMAAASLFLSGNLCERNLTKLQVATVCDVPASSLHDEYVKLHSKSEAIVFAVWEHFKPLLGEQTDLYRRLDGLPQ